jgi:hypothetical protein
MHYDDGEIVLQCPRPGGAADHPVRRNRHRVRPKAKENEEIRGMLNAGHRNGAMAGRCVVRGKIVETEELPAYCAVALAGLNDLPDTIMTRAVVVRMHRRASTELIEPWRPRVNGLC